MQKNAPIGVLDSGVGGLSVLKCLQAALPQEDFIYVGDTARTPYGPRSEAEVRRFVGEIIDYLDGRGVKLVVIACNTLTVLGVDTLKGSHAFEIVGMSKGAHWYLPPAAGKRSACLPLNLRSTAVRIRPRSWQLMTVRMSILRPARSLCR